MATAWYGGRDDVDVGDAHFFLGLGAGGWGLRNSKCGGWGMKPGGDKGEMDRVALGGSVYRKRRNKGRSRREDLIRKFVYRDW